MELCCTSHRLITRSHRLVTEKPGNTQSKNKKKQTKQPTPNQQNVPNLWRVKQVKRVRSHYLAHSSIPRLSQLLQQQLGYHTSLHSGMCLSIAWICRKRSPKHIPDTTVNQWDHVSHDTAISEDPHDSGRARIVVEYYLPPSTACGWVPERISTSDVKYQVLRASLLKPTSTSSNKSRSAWTGAIQALQLPGMNMCQI